MQTHSLQRSYCWFRLAVAAFPACAFSQPGTIQVVVLGAPPDANRGVVVVSGAALGYGIKRQMQLTGPGSSNVAAIAVPPGKDYLVRAVVYKSGTSMPLIRMAGAADHVTVSGAGLSPITLALNVPQVSLYTTTTATTAQLAGAKALVGDSATAVLWIADAKPKANCFGSRYVSKLRTAATDMYTANFTVSQLLGGLGGYAQLGIFAFDFANEIETPLFVWPDLNHLPPLYLSPQPPVSLRSADTAQPATGPTDVTPTASAPPGQYVVTKGADGKLNRTFVPAEASAGRTPRGRR